MSRLAFDDTLEPLGIAVGVLVVLMALGTVAGMPWETNPDTAAVVIQLLGVLGAIAVGVVLVRLARSD